MLVTAALHLTGRKPRLSRVGEQQKSRNDETQHLNLESNRLHQRKPYLFRYDHV